VGFKPSHAVSPRVTDDADDAREIDVDHVAELANLPLDDDEADDLEAACRDVLDAFQLEDVDAPDAHEPPSRTFPDEPEPWPRDEVDAIVDQFPDDDGRQLTP